MTQPSLRHFLETTPFKRAVPAIEPRTLRQAPHLQGFLNEARVVAQAALEEPITPLPLALWLEYARNGERLRFETAYHRRRERAAALAVVALADENKSALHALEGTLWEICNEYAWCIPAHQLEAFDPVATVDLFAANTAHMLAELSALLPLESVLKIRISAELERRVFVMFDHDERFPWESKTNNWSAACAGGVGMAALLEVRDAARLEGMLQRLLEALEVYQGGFSAEGGTAEGVAYWLYGFGYFTYFSEMLRERTGSAFDLLNTVRARAIAEFPLHLHLSGDAFVNFSDAPEHCPLHSGFSSRLNARFGLCLPFTPSSFHRDHCYRWGHISRNLFWTTPTTSTSTSPRVSWLPDLGVLVARGQDAVFATKGGHNAEPHNHNDLGHFVLHVGGETILCDLGRGVYSREYFSQSGYDTPHRGSHGHSVPVIDGQRQRSGREARAHLLEFAQSDSETRLSLELHDAYDVPKLERFERHFEWRNDALRLRDEFRFHDPPESLEEAFVSLFEPSLEPGRIVWRGDQSQVSLQFDAVHWSPRLEVIETRAHLGEPLTVYRVGLHAVRLEMIVGFVGLFKLERGSVSNRADPMVSFRTEV
jgi:hypothetical protein